MKQYASEKLNKDIVYKRVTPMRLIKDKSRSTKKSASF